jgi:Protein of unknown function (DUF2478)
MFRRCYLLVVNRFGKRERDGKGLAQDSIKFADGMSSARA